MCERDLAKLANRRIEEVKKAAEDSDGVSISFRHVLSDTR